MKIKIYEWVDKTGKPHKIPEGSCVICKHCTDLWLDPLHNNDIYAHACELNKEDEFLDRDTPLDDFCSGYERDDDVKELEETYGEKL